MQGRAFVLTLDVIFYILIAMLLAGAGGTLGIRTLQSYHLETVKMEARSVDHALQKYGIAHRSVLQNTITIDKEKGIIKNKEEFQYPLAIGKFGEIYNDPDNVDLDGTAPSDVGLVLGYFGADLEFLPLGQRSSMHEGKNLYKICYVPQPDGKGGYDLEAGIQDGLKTKTYRYSRRGNTITEGVYP